MTQPNVEARELLLRHISGSMAALAVGAAARLELADAIGDIEADVADLARFCGAPPHDLIRLLRALTSLGLCIQRSPTRFALSEAGALLRKGRPDSLHALTLLYTDHATLRPWIELERSVRTGRPAFDEVFGMPVFTYLAQHPDLSATFNTAMGEGTRQFAGVLPDHYDFGQFRTITDVGGGDGTLLAAILGRHPNLAGVVFDTAEGVAQTAKTLEAADVSNRCSVIAGDFFDKVPAGADLYVIKSVLHNWDDERAAVILRRCRDAMSRDSRLLIIDPVLPDIASTGDTVENAYLVDLQMLVNVGGRERTRSEFTQLCALAALSVVDIFELPAGADVALIETVPA